MIIKIEVTNENNEVEVSEFVSYEDAQKFIGEKMGLIPATPVEGGLPEDSEANASETTPDTSEEAAA